jgi:hypothetical protein
MRKIGLVNIIVIQNMFTEVCVPRGFYYYYQVFYIYCSANFFEIRLK